jgi:DNA excision repair protein ERCC-3
VTRLPHLEAGVVYRGRHLFLPRSAVSSGILEGLLTFGADPEEQRRALMRTHKFHYQVPLYTLTDKQVEELGCEVVDLRPTEFDSIDLTAKPAFQLRDNQVEAWEDLKAAHSGVLNLACGLGKTVLAWNKAAHEKVSTLVVSPQRAHLDNWLGELDEFFDYRGETGWIQGKKFDYEAGICLSTVNMLARRAQTGRLPADFYRKFGLVIYDECHIMGADFFSQACAVGAGMRLGLSATPVRTDRCEGIFLTNLGPIFHSNVEQDLDPTVYVLDMGVFFREDERKGMLDRNGKFNVGRAHKVLAQNEDRNSLIQRLLDELKKRGRIVYALSHGPDHLEHLHAQNPGSTVIHGKTKSKERLERLNGSDLVFASLGVGAAAYNRKDLDTLVLMTPFAARSHSAIAYEQSVGRVLRALDGKPNPLVFLLLDSSVDTFRGMIHSLIRKSREKGYRVIRKWRWEDLP